MRQHNERKIAHAALAAIVVSVAMARSVPVAVAQEENAADEAAISYLERRADCLSHYQFGSVHILLAPETSQRAITPGATLTLQGTVENMNEIPLVDGRIIARVLREDARVADEQWHPVVAEQVLPGDYGLRARETQPFTFTWVVPGRAPRGLYRVEFFYLAGQRFVFAGVPYVPNVVGAAHLFSVGVSSSPAAVAFDRGAVQLNGSPVALRSVPAAVEPGRTVTVSASLAAEGPGAQPVTMSTKVYDWSDTDGETALHTESASLTITPGIPNPVSLTWTPPGPGVYEVIFIATPADRHVLPSLLKVRFPVRGFAPRLLYAGLGGLTEDGQTVVTACTLNGTEGDGEGFARLRATVAGRVLESAESAIGPDVAAVNFRIPNAHLSKAVTIEADVLNAEGVVTDRYVGATAVRSTALRDDPSSGRPLPTNRGRIIAALATVVVAMIVLLFIRRRRKTW